MTKLTTTIVAIAMLPLFSVFALAECKINGPSPMYLGNNQTYQLAITAQPGDLCPIFFSAEADGVSFTSAEISVAPASGKLSKAGKFDFGYSAPANGADAFTLKLCGTDAAGTGCNKLEYAVQVK